jgi:predicted GH43/DUF377 family glycosyl hydrolase
MKNGQIDVIRRPGRLVSDDTRTIIRLFLPGSEERIRKIIDRVLSMSADQLDRVFKQVQRDFTARHRNIDELLLRNFRKVEHLIEEPDKLTDRQRWVIGAYFSMEYSIEAAALFNPSIVPHPDQQGVPEGSMRFIVSLRATGEGHVSSIVFRTVTVDEAGNARLNPVSPFVQHGEPVVDRDHDRQRFFHKLIEMGAYNDLVGDVLDALPETFVQDDLETAIHKVGEKCDFNPLFEDSAEQMRWLARSNYHLRFAQDASPSEVVIFPVTENESRGIEDARFVRFVDDDGKVTYYGTYTAYNGFKILPQILETEDFREFRITTLNGRYAQNKGMALFPRPIDGWYMMVSRVDGENLYIMPSKNLRFWNDATKIDEPTYPWEFVQIGNCGSPIETPAGWLLLTHGVGPVRRYCIGAILLDLDDPTRIIGHLKQPLMIPNEEERDGYVPNVVYSCGAAVHAGRLILPYAASDSETRMATVRLDELLNALTA